MRANVPPEAVAYATQFIVPADTRSIIETTRPPAEGPVLVAGPGTGLGSAVLMPGEPRAHVLATEAGQISLAPGTQRERQVMQGLVTGQSNKAIAREYDISPRTVEVYRANVMTKMQAGSLSELVRFAIRGGLVED